MTKSSDKIAIFVDGANLHWTAKALGLDVPTSLLAAADAVIE
jgi:hypothetical protein